MATDPEDSRRDWVARPGGNPVNLQFQQLSYKAPRREGNQVKEVLRSVSGQCLAGRLTAILGPSGAGKTTLLNILSGFRTTGVAGAVLVNGQRRHLEKFRRQCCYIAQEFAMLPALTVWETMEVAAGLKLGRQLRSISKRSVVSVMSPALYHSMLPALTVWETMEVAAGLKLGRQLRSISKRSVVSVMSPALYHSMLPALTVWETMEVAAGLKLGRKLRSISKRSVLSVMSPALYHSLLPALTVWETMEVAAGLKLGRQLRSISKRSVVSVMSPALYHSMLPALTVWETMEVAAGLKLGRQLRSISKRSVVSVMSPALSHSLLPALTVWETMEVAAGLKLGRQLRSISKRSVVSVMSPALYHSMLPALTVWETMEVAAGLKLGRQLRSISKRSVLSVMSPALSHSLLPALTVWETMEVAAGLKLGRQLRSISKRSVIEEILELLGLSNTCDTKVSSLSGGEKKRLSLAVELITNPPVMFFDEPTSGLDSCSSAQVISHLKMLAVGGHTVTCVVHQPSSRLFGMFDDVLVLSEGRCLYCGPVELMLEAFGAAGFQCPQYYNRADFAIEVAYRERGGNLDCLVTNNTEYHSHALKRLTNKDEISGSENSQDISDETAAMLRRDAVDSRTSPYAASTALQFWIVLRRSLICTFRDTHLAQIRLLAHVLIALVLGAVYYDIGNDAAKVASNMSLLFFFLMFLYFSSAMPTVQTFPMEREVFLREHLNNWYSILSYYLAKIMAEFPLQVVCPTLFLLCSYFLSAQPNQVVRFALMWLVCVLMTVMAHTMGLVIGAIFNSQLGVFLVAAVNIPMLLFSGFFMRLGEMPWLVRGLAHLSYYRYAFEAAMLTTYGYGRAGLDCSQPYCQYRSPDKLLQDMGMENASLAVDVAALAAWTLFLQAGFLLVLCLAVRSSQ
ncbi:ATP-binding cassette sub-family G member 1-like isoform X2 [Bacillus rossius redtenbacheri]|uniref:ATP-binding cassette sub-family G member 1-like isoform X2 n=1 Tax=Bacillus rossius redtenbacheri TaxID=93214 RepID=UPI002FDCFEB5